jgi:cytochrome c-type biogenesis protein CcmH/NrfG
VTGTLDFRLGELFADVARCSFLDDAETEQLVEGKISDARQREWERHATACVACAELLRDLESIQEIESAGLTGGERRAFRAADSRTAAALGVGRQARPRRRFWIMLPALAAVLLMALWVGRNPIRQIPVESFPLLAPPAVRGADQADLWTDLERLWSNDDMRGAAVLLDQAVGERPEDAGLWFYLGLARLRAGEPSSAIGALQRADELQATVPSEHTRWMLAAAYEQTGRKAEACAILAAVVELDGSRAEAARQAAGRYCGETGSAP